jgi:hypothetical protein
LFQITGKDDHRKWTSAVIVAEIEKVDAPIALLDADYLPHHAARGADVFSGFSDGEASRGRCRAHRICEDYDSD